MLYEVADHSSHLACRAVLLPGENLAVLFKFINHQLSKSRIFVPGTSTLAEYMRSASLRYSR